ncbi:MAG: aminotransferase class I/II-fold pyridoxal phosphate-dependent enzyme [Prevotella sp.]|jgi:glycine C-acetyltransferase|nr:aminotransferase class I/II-fold pyridoxal phosphate-dependent enzyme [Prevotella sp.]
MKYAMNLHGESKEKYTVNDFTLRSLNTNAIDRANEFQKWMMQSRANNHEIYWNESFSGISPQMTLINATKNESYPVISFISNDYLGMSQREETKAAGIEAIKKYGTGACAAPIIGGYLDIHKELEGKIAKFTGQEDALIFSSGFGVNVGVLNALLGKEDLALIDMCVHTSVLDGLRSTNIKRLKHNDPEYIEFVLKREVDNYKTKMVIIDGAYSHDGDIANLNEIYKICKEYGALLYMDDAHGIGVFGDTGKGVAEHYNMLGKIDIVTGTFSKSFGAVGGFVSCSKPLADYLRYYANTTVFSASITPQSAASILKALDLLAEKPDIRTKLWDNVSYLKNKLTKNGFDIKNTVSPIFPVMVRDPFKAKEVTRLLKEKGIYAIAIVYPAVTDKDARIRISLTASHEFKHIDYLVDSLVEIRTTINF